MATTMPPGHRHHQHTKLPCGCYYRDKNSINKFILGKVTAEGTTVSEPFTLDTNWNYKHFVDPAQFSQGSW